MFLITDQNDVIVDMASRLENLSRGYAYPDRIVSESDRFDMILGDTYKDGQLTRNIENHVKIIQRRSNEAKISAWIAAWLRTLAMQDLKNKDELPAEYL